MQPAFRACQTPGRVKPSNANSAAVEFLPSPRWKTQTGTGLASLSGSPWSGRGLIFSVYMYVGGSVKGEVCLMPSKDWAKMKTSDQQIVTTRTARLSRAVSLEEVDAGTCPLHTSSTTGLR